MIVMAMIVIPFLHLNLLGTRFLMCLWMGNGKHLLYSSPHVVGHSDEDEEDLTAADGYNDLSLDGPLVTMSRTMYNNNNKNQFEQYLNVHGFVEVVVVL